MLDIAVIGGGAAGLMAAGRACELGANVTVFEKNQKFGRKLAITGKGRCNVTNNCSCEDFFRKVVTNPKFLYSSVHGFSPEDTMRFFETRGVKLKTERGGRVFPVSDRAFDIVDALGAYASRCRIIRSAVTDVVTENGTELSVVYDGKKERFDRIILCTGGASYPLTGSTGDGYRIAESLGHTVIPPHPSLIPIETEEAWCGALQGLSLKNVSFKVLWKQKLEYSELGEMMFTHFGISGPLVLSASAYMKNTPLHEYKLAIDLKPALDEKQLDRRILNDFEKYGAKDFDNSLSELLPRKLIPVIVELSGIAPHRKVYSITKSERQSLVRLLKSLELTPRTFRPIDEAIITSGGISVREISPKTMESKLLPGLYFAGEIIDVDACTGGYNLQIAFSTARAAAEGAVGQ